MSDTPEMNEPTYDQLCQGVVRMSTKVMLYEQLIGEIFATLQLPKNRSLFADDENHRRLWAIVDGCETRFAEIKNKKSG